MKTRPQIVFASMAASFFALAAGGTEIWAQAAIVAEESGEEEVIVTARRRAESLQDVPIAVSAFNEDQLRQLQADNLSGIQYATPNLYFDQGDAANAVVFLRGIGQNDSLAFADAGVGVYIDDVFIARSQAAFLELFDVERVEVLRGPQGTLYGRNTIGGAVKFVSTTPTDEFKAYFEAGGGNFGFATAKGSISGPIAPGLVRGKAAFAFTHRNGYNFNSFDGESDGDLRSFAGRVGLTFTPYDRLEFVVSVDGKVDRPDRSRSPVRETAITGAPTLTTLQTFPASDDPFRVDVNANGLSDLSGFGAALTTRFKAGPKITLESITAFRSLDFNLNLDTDGSPLPVLDILVIQDQFQISQELRATYSGERFSVTGGLYYFHDDDSTFSGFDDGAATIFGFPVVAFGFPNAALADTDQVTNSYAAFFDASAELAPRWELSAGLRYTYEDRRSQRRFENFFDPTISVIANRPDFLAGTGFPGQTLSGDANFDALTPRVSLSFKPHRGFLLYASVSRGFKSGGFDGRANSDFGFQPFAPEFVWSYEGGVKSTWLDGKVTVNANYFYNDYTDLQVTSFSADPDTGVFVSQFTNAAGARIQGAELEFAAKPVPGLSFNGSLGWLDARYREFDILVGAQVIDVSDRPLVNAPRWNASLGVTYERRIAGGLRGVLHVDGAYRGNHAVEITASTNLNQPATGLLNALAALKSANGRWELQMGVRNAANEAIRVQGFNLSAFPGVELGFFTAPRTYDGRLVLRY